MFTGGASTSKSSSNRSSSSKTSSSSNSANPSSKPSPLQRNPMQLYMHGELLHATSLRLVLLLGRCCALIAEGNRKRGWHPLPSSVAALNNWDGAAGVARSDELSGAAGRAAQARVLREGGATAAAAHAERGGRTFVLALRSGSHALLHSEALRACGFTVDERVLVMPASSSNADAPGARSVHGEC